MLCASFVSFRSVLVPISLSVIEWDTVPAETRGKAKAERRKVREGAACLLLQEEKTNQLHESGSPQR